MKINIKILFFKYNKLSIIYFISYKEDKYDNYIKNIL